MYLDLFIAFICPKNPGMVTFFDKTNNKIGHRQKTGLRTREKPENNFGRNLKGTYFRKKNNKKLLKKPSEN